MSNTTFFDLGRGPGGQLSHVMMGTMGGDVYRRPLKGLYTGKTVAPHNGWVTAMSLDAEYTGAVDGTILKHSTNYKVLDLKLVRQLT